MRPLTMSSIATPHPRTQQVGPLRWARLPYRTGEAAEPLARAWLAREWHTSQAALSLLRNRHGRPYLSQARHPGWDIGWSHSGDGLLVALAHGVRVGVDLERQRERPRAAELARRFFAQDEAQWLNALPPERHQAMFVRVWCAKEAVLKAHGRGIAFGLARLRFDWDPAADRLLLRDCDPVLGLPAHWHLHEMQPQAGECAVLAWHAHAPDADRLDNPAP